MLEVLSREGVLKIQHPLVEGLTERKVKLGSGEGESGERVKVGRRKQQELQHTILESMIAFAISFPKNLNLLQTSSTTLKGVLGPRGVGKTPTGLWMYWGVLVAPPWGAPGTGHRSPRKSIKSERWSSRDTKA